MASPFLSFTTTVFPASQSVAERVKIPLGVIVRPMTEGVKVPLLSPNREGVVRCSDCGGYLSPFVIWVSAGRAWMCPLCKTKNPVSDALYSPLNTEGRRTDATVREDLNSLEYDVIAPEGFSDRPPMPPTYCFVVDLSQAAKASGLIDSFCEVLDEILVEESFPGLPRTQVAFILFDTDVHLLVFPSETQGVQMVSISQSTETAFLPVPLDQVLVSVCDFGKGISSALGIIRKMSDRMSVENTGFRVALAYIHTVLHARGGKALIFLSDYHPCEKPPLQSKEIRPNSADPWYREIGKQYCSLGITCDLFISASHYCDLQSLSPLSEQTSGQLYFYPNPAPINRVKIFSELYMNITRSSFWETSIRTRINSDWKITQAYGHFSMRAGDLLIAPVFDSSETVGYRIEMDEPVVKQGKVYIQTAVLHTTDDGERRIRVINTAIKVSANLQEIYISAEQETVAAMWAKEAIIKTREMNEYEAGWKSIESHLVDVYAINGGFPESLSFLPHLALGLMKLPLFFVQKRADLPLDLGSFYRFAVSSWSASTIAYLAYPRLYAIHEMTTGDALPALNLTIKDLKPDGIYCLDSGLEILIWIGED